MHIDIDRILFFERTMYLDGAFKKQLRIIERSFKNYTVQMEQQSLTTIISQNDFETTCNKVKNIIEANENLKLIAELAHHENAARVGLDLRPTHLFLFGNPKMGTPLMKESQPIAIDLPQKILVWNDEGNNTNISYNTPSYLAERHGIANNQQIIEKVATALKGITEKAASK